MKKGVFVEFKPDGTEVQIIGTGIDVLKAMELVLSALDESLGSSALSDDMLERLILKRMQAKQHKNIYDDFMHEMSGKKASEVLGLLSLINYMHSKTAKRPEYTITGNRIMWGSEHDGKNVIFLGRRVVTKKGIKVPDSPIDKWIDHSNLNEVIGCAIALYKVGESYCIVRDSGKVITMEAY